VCEERGIKRRKWKDWQGKRRKLLLYQKDIEVGQNVKSVVKSARGDCKNHVYY